MRKVVFLQELGHDADTLTILSHFRTFTFTSRCRDDGIGVTLESLNIDDQKLTKLRALDKKSFLPLKALQPLAMWKDQLCHLSHCTQTGDKVLELVNNMQNPLEI